MSDLPSTPPPLAWLAGQIRHLEANAPAAPRVSSGLAPLDRLLPGGGLARGSLVEWLSGGQECKIGCHGNGCHGATTLALLAAREACRDGQALVVLDQRHWFYPLAAAAWGVNLARMVLVRCPGPEEELWTLDQVLRCRGVGAVLAWPERLPGRAFRRLQLAAKVGGVLGCLVRQAAARQAVSWADVRWLIEPQIGMIGAPGRRLRASLLRCRGRPLTEDAEGVSCELSVVGCE